MTINERIRFLRKNHLKMSQAQFALLIGMKQTSVSTFEKNGATVTEQTIKSICFAVEGLNEDWLRNGNEPMILETPQETMEQLKNKFNLDEFAYSFVYEYLKLDKEKRSLLRNFFYNILKPINVDEIIDNSNNKQEKEKHFFDIFNGLSPEFQDHLFKTAKNLLETQQKMQSNNNFYTSVDNVDKTVDKQTEFAEELTLDECAIEELEEEYKKTLHSASGTSSTALPTIENTNENKAM